MTLKREQITTTKSPNLYLNYLLAWSCLPTSTFGGKKKALLPIYHLPSDLQSWHFYLLYWSCSPYCHQCLLIARFDGLFSVPTVSCASNIWCYSPQLSLEILSPFGFRWALSPGTFSSSDSSCSFSMTTFLHLLFK